LDTCPSGRQVQVTYNNQRTTVVEVGGGIRRHEVGGRSVFGPYTIDPMCDGGHGAPLIPWPNRLADGQYRFDDEHQLQAAGTGPFDGTVYDFRESRLLEATTLDFAFTDLVRDTDDRDRARLGRTDRRTGEVWAEDGYRDMELYTGDPGRIWSSPQESHSGWCGDRHGRRLVHHHSGLDWIRGKAPGHCPGAAHLVVSGTCSPPREATSADQLPLAMVGQ
jgi:hypothetical protein